MLRTRGAEMPQRQSPRGSLRASSSDSDPLHHRPVTDSRAKLADRRSPRGGLQSGVNQKKLGSRIADLESQLGQAQEELKTLKDQLVSAEDAKKLAQEELEKKTKKSNATVAASSKGKSSPTENQESDKTDEIQAPDYILQETDVYEVPVDMVQPAPAIELGLQSDQQEKDAKLVDISPQLLAFPEPQKTSPDESGLKDDEIMLLRAKVEEKEKELNVSVEENGSLKKQLDNANSAISSAETREKAMALRLTQLEEDLKASDESGAQLRIQLEGVEGVREALEAEMKKLRIQTEQWRKAADAAAAILAGGNGRFSERSSSMDKHLDGVIGPSADGYDNLLGSPGLTEYSNDGYESGKKKGSGIKMFGEMWKKKGQK